MPRRRGGEVEAGTTLKVIATGGTGGVFYPYGGGLARVLTDKLPDAEATAAVTDLVATPNLPVRFVDTAAFAAAALTGGNPFRTTMPAWKYCLPAFLVPFMFTLSPDGVGLLLLAVAFAAHLLRVRRTTAPASAV